MAKRKGKIKNDRNLTVIDGNSYDPLSGISELMRGLVNPRKSLLEIRQLMDNEDYVTNLNLVGIEAICELVIHGTPPTKIAEKAGVTMTNFIKWLRRDSERLSLYEEAKNAAGESLRYHALAASSEVPDGADLHDVQKLHVNTAIKVANAIDPINTGDKKQTLTVNMEFGIEERSEKKEEQGES